MAAILRSLSASSVDVTTYVRTAPGNVFAIVDGARGPAVLEWVRTSGLPHECLFQGRLADQMSDTAPQIVQLTPFSPQSQPFLEGWLDWWGILLRSRADLKSVRAHVRHFTLVDLPDEGRVYFAFFDPRALRPFLECASGEQLQAFFGPIEEFGLPITEADGHIGFNVLVNPRPGQWERAREPVTRLRISREQESHFQFSVRRELHHRLTRLFLRIMPACTRRASYSQILEMVMVADVRATNLEITTDGGLIRFISLSMVAGRMIDYLPQVYKYLTLEDGTTPDEKIETLSRQFGLQWLRSPCAR